MQPSPPPLKPRASKLKQQIPAVLNHAYDGWIKKREAVPPMKPASYSVNHLDLD
jgi:hypothetical protein